MGEVVGQGRGGVAGGVEAGLVGGEDGAGGEILGFERLHDGDQAVVTFTLQFTVGEVAGLGVGLGMTTAYSMPAASSFANNSASAVSRSGAGALVLRYASKSIVGMGSGLKGEDAFAHPAAFEPPSHQMSDETRLAFAIGDHVYEVHREMRYRAGRLLASP